VGEDLRIAVATFAARPRVLVAVDFDGTLAPFVTDPLQAKALPGGLEALRAAAALGGVTVAVVSGRDLATLASLTGIGPGDGITLIGSHGAQTNLGDQATPGDQTTPGDHPGHEGQTRLEPVGQGVLLDDKATSRLASLGDELEAIRSRYPAVRLEYKPSAVVLHTLSLIHI
jgi:trehalose 6-phosphate phosphatase